MARLIDVDKQEPIIEELENICMNNEYVLELLAELKNQSIVDAEPVRRGKWIDVRRGYLFECSMCKAQVNSKQFKSNLKYCPNCGSKMYEEGKNERI